MNNSRYIFTSSDKQLVKETLEFAKDMFLESDGVEFYIEESAAGASLYVRGEDNLELKLRIGFACRAFIEGWRKHAEKGSTR